MFCGYLGPAGVVGVAGAASVLIYCVHARDAIAAIAVIARGNVIKPLPVVSNKSVIFNPVAVIRVAAEPIAAPVPTDKASIAAVLKAVLAVLAPLFCASFVDLVVIIISPVFM
jgi:hypothetical protein